MSFSADRAARTAICFAVAVAAMCFTPRSWADSWNQRTEITLNEALEIPGATLKPGDYVVKLADSQSNRHIVRFLNEDETEVIATVLAISNQRMEATGDTTFTFYEMPQGQQPALRGWFFPGRQIGHEFVYPQDRAQQIASTTGDYVPAMDREADRYLRDQREDDEYVAEYGRTEVRAYGREQQPTTVEEGMERNRAAREQREQAGNQSQPRDYSDTYVWRESQEKQTETATAQNRSGTDRSGTYGQTDRPSTATTQDGTQRQTYGRTDRQDTTTTAQNRAQQQTYGQSDRQDNTMMAQNRAQQQSPYQGDNQLPDTASNMPWLALAGFVLLLGAGIVFRFA